MMENFDYKEAVKRLEEIELKVQDTKTPLDEIDILLKEAAGLISACRGYLRSIREAYEEDLRN